MGTWFARGEITALLRNYVKTHKLGRVLSADTGFRLGDDTVRAPDVAFTRQERIQSLKSKGFAKAPRTLP